MTNTRTLEAAVVRDLWDDEAVDINGYADLCVKNWRAALEEGGLRVGRELSREWKTSERPDMVSLISIHEVEDAEGV